MFFDGQPYLETYVGDEKLLLHFDTGGGLSLNSEYYEKYKERIEVVGRFREEGGIGGFGGLKKIPQYYLPSLSFRVGDVSKDFKEIMVLTKPVGFRTTLGGSVGSDFVQQFDKVIINFNKMFITIE